MGYNLRFMVIFFQHTDDMISLSFGFVVVIVAVGKSVFSLRLHLQKSD